jgi:hypothetical protein
MSEPSTERVYVRFRNGTARTDVVHGPTPLIARLEAYSHADGLRERPDVENAFRLDADENIVRDDLPE